MARRKKIPASVRAQVRAARRAEDNPGPTTKAQLARARLAARQVRVERGSARDLRWAPDASETLRGAKPPKGNLANYLEFRQDGLVRVLREAWVACFEADPAGAFRRFNTGDGFYAQPGQVFIVLSPPGALRPGYTEVLTPTHGPALIRATNVRQVDPPEEG